MKVVHRRWATMAIPLAVGALFAAQAAWPQARPKPPRPVSEIRGQIRTANDSPVGRGALVTLESAHGGLVIQTQTDEQGRFTFSQLSEGVYVVTIHQPGYHDASEKVDLSTNPTAYLQITLHPKPTSSESASSPSLGPVVSARDLNVPEAAQQNFDQGRRLMLESKKPAKSVPYLQKAIHIAPRFAHAHFLLGAAYMDMGRWADAQAALEKATQLDDRLALAHLALGACLNQEGKFAAAEKPLIRALELNPEAAEGHYELGRVYWALGRWQEAEPHARKAAQLKPNLAPVHVLLGNIFLRKREAASALNEFKEYLRLEPDGLFATPAREMVAKIEKALNAPR